MKILEKFNLKGKKGVVTGGARGLCRDITEAYIEAGAEVIIVDILDEVFETADSLSKGNNKVYAIKADLTNTDDIEKVFDQVMRIFDGQIDFLFNGAGIQYREKAENFPIEKWNKVIDVNLNAVFYMSQKFGKYMIQKECGKIINMASMTAYFGSVNICAYSASKGGIAQLTKALSNEWAKYNVHVNAIAPGYMKTKITESLEHTNPKEYEMITSRIPEGRWGTGSDLQGIAVFLASNASDYLTGVVIPVDGGYLGR